MEKQYKNSKEYIENQTLINSIKEKLINVYDVTPELVDKLITCVATNTSLEYDYFLKKIKEL